MRATSIFLFVFGLLLALSLAIVAIWPDLEASLFDAAMTAQESLDALKCPLIISGGRSEEITATFANPFERKVRFQVRSRISAGFVTLIRQESTLLELEPGETQELSWPVSREDAAFGRIVLARVHALRSNLVPPRDSSCGILVLDLPGLSGRQLVTAVLLASLVSLFGGAALWVRHERPLLGRKLELSYSGGALAGLILAAVVVGMLGWWIAGLLALLLALLLVIAVMERFLISR